MTDLENPHARPDADGDAALGDRSSERRHSTEDERRDAEMIRLFTEADDVLYTARDPVFQTENRLNDQAKKLLPRDNYIGVDSQGNEFMRSMPRADIYGNGLDSSLRERGRDDFSPENLESRWGALADGGYAHDIPSSREDHLAGYDSDRAREFQVPDLDDYLRRYDSADKLSTGQTLEDVARDFVEARVGDIESIEKHQLPDQIVAFMVSEGMIESRDDLNMQDLVKLQTEIRKQHTQIIETVAKLYMLSYGGGDKDPGLTFNLENIQNIGSDIWNAAGEERWADAADALGEFNRTVPRDRRIDLEALVAECQTLTVEEMEIAELYFKRQFGESFGEEGGMADQAIENGRTRDGRALTEAEKEIYQELVKGFDLETTAERVRTLFAGLESSDETIGWASHAAGLGGAGLFMWQGFTRGQNNFAPGPTGLSTPDDRRGLNWFKNVVPAAAVFDGGLAYLFSKGVAEHQMRYWTNGSSYRELELRLVLPPERLREVNNYLAGEREPRDGILSDLDEKIADRDASPIELRGELLGFCNSFDPDNNALTETRDAIIATDDSITMVQVRELRAQLEAELNASRQKQLGQDLGFAVDTLEPENLSPEILAELRALQANFSADAAEETLVSIGEKIDALVDADENVESRVSVAELAVGGLTDSELLQINNLGVLGTEEIQRYVAAVGLLEVLRRSDVELTGDFSNTDSGLKDLFQESSRTNSMALESDHIDQIVDELYLQLSSTEHVDQKILNTELINTTFQRVTSQHTVEGVDGKTARQVIIERLQEKIKEEMTEEVEAENERREQEAREGEEFVKALEEYEERRQAAEDAGEEFTETEPEPRFAEATIPGVVDWTLDNSNFQSLEELQQAIGNLAYEAVNTEQIASRIISQVGHFDLFSAEQQITAEEAMQQNAVIHRIIAFELGDPTVESGHPLDSIVLSADIVEDVREKVFEKLTERRDLIRDAKEYVYNIGYDEPDINAPVQSIMQSIEQLEGGSVGNVDPRRPRDYYLSDWDDAIGHHEGSAYGQYTQAMADIAPNRSERQRIEVMMDAMQNIQRPPAARLFDLLSEDFDSLSGEALDAALVENQRAIQEWFREHRGELLEQEATFERQFGRNSVSSVTVDELPPSLRELLALKGMYGEIMQLNRLGLERIEADTSLSAEERSAAITELIDLNRDRSFPDTVLYILEVESKALEERIELLRQQLKDEPSNAGRDAQIDHAILIAMAIFEETVRAESNDEPEEQLKTAESILTKIKEAEDFDIDHGLLNQVFRSAFSDLYEISLGDILSAIAEYREVIEERIEDLEAEIALQGGREAIEAGDDEADKQLLIELDRLKELID